jgi:hypothetical protein
MNNYELLKFREWLEELDYAEVLIEGIDIDGDSKTVKFNNNHENNVDTSSIINPTYTEIDGIPVVSIFKRKHNKEKSDGSPLIHALKGNFGWTIDEKSIIELFKQFLKISKKIDTKYDTIINVYSRSTLNTQFLSRLNKVVKADNHITDLFMKLEASEVLMQATKSNIGKENFNKLMKALQKMIDKDNYFTYKMLPTDLRQYICTSCKVEERDDLMYSEMINDKDILILDDTISSGKTISDSVYAINETFNPKSITVITLFSKI